MVEFNSGGNLSEQKGGKLSERYRLFAVLCKNTQGRKSTMKKFLVFFSLIVMIVMMTRAIEASEILEAVKKGNIAKVKTLLSKNIKLIDERDKNKWTLLHWAAIGGYKEIAELLISKGADVNAQNEFDETPLHWAVGRGPKIIDERKKDLVELLISKGADINAKDKFIATPLHYAVRCGNNEIAKLLILKGADVNAKEKNGWTPLHWAITMAEYREGKKIVDLLINRGADVNARNIKGETPLKTTLKEMKRSSQKKIYEEIEHELRKHDAKE